MVKPSTRTRIAGGLYFARPRAQHGLIRPTIKIKAPPSEGLFLFRKEAGITIGKELVFFSDRFFISGEHAFPVVESTYQHDQS